MHTHLGNALLCLISSLLSLSSSLSRTFASMPSCSRRYILITTLLLTLTRSRMTTLQEDQEEEEEKYKDQVRAQCHPLEALSHLILSL